MNLVDENCAQIMGYQQRIHDQCKERRMFQFTEQRTCDQAKAIRKECLFKNVEFETMKRRLLENNSRRSDENTVLTNKSNLRQLRNF